MESQDERCLAALRLLLQSSHLSAPDELPALVDEAGRVLGALRAFVYLVDYDQVVLVPLAPTGSTSPVSAVPVEGTLAGRTFGEITQHVVGPAEARTLWSPLLNGTDRLGVLQLELPAGLVADESFRQDVRDVAALVAELVLTRSAYGDAVERGRRLAALTVPAELQWRQLPPLTFVSPQVAVAGVLAPAVEVAGDSFDYAVNAGTAHVAIFDAMGHGLQATLLAGVAVATLRNSRRSGSDLPTTVRAMDAVLTAQFGGDSFVTGIVGELDLATGWWRWITCGHPSALLLRGTQVVKQLDAVVGPPLGLGLLDEQLSVGQERLQPGDRLLMFTDGVVEARDQSGEFFGLDRLVDLVTRQASAGRAVAETLRRLNLAVLAHTAGRLQDDATTVVVEWSTVDPDANAPTS